MARTMVSGAATVEWFDVWEGERLVHGTPPTMRQQKPRR